MIGAPKFPAGVKFLIGVFPDLFGTAAGRRLQSWAMKWVCTSPSPAGYADHRIAATTNPIDKAQSGCHAAGVGAGLGVGLESAGRRSELLRPAQSDRISRQLAVDRPTGDRSVQRSNAVYTVGRVPLTVARVV